MSIRRHLIFPLLIPWERTCCDQLESDMDRIRDKVISVMRGPIFCKLFSYAIKSSTKNNRSLLNVYIYKL